MFNALKYIKGLEAVGFRRDQAEAQVQLVIDAIEEDVATKGDINEVKGEIASVRGEVAQLRGEMGDLRGEMGELRGAFAELRAEFAELRAEITAEIIVIKNQLPLLETKIVFRLGTVMVTCTTLIIAAMGLALKFH